MIKYLINPLKYLALICLITGCLGKFRSVSKKMELGNYETAIPILEKIANESEQTHLKGKAHFMIGEAYRLSNRIDKAMPYYKQALENEHFYTDNLEFYYGYALKTNGMYAEAKQQFVNYSKTGTDLRIS